MHRDRNSKNENKSDLFILGCKVKRVLRWRKELKSFFKGKRSKRKRVFRKPKGKWKSGFAWRRILLFLARLESGSLRNRVRIRIKRIIRRIIIRIRIIKGNFCVGRKGKRRKPVYFFGWRNKKTSSFQKNYRRRPKLLDDGYNGPRICYEIKKIKRCFGKV